MIEDRSQIREGMAVYSSDGEKLGKVLSREGATFTIEKGFFFPKDYVARYDQIADVNGDDIRLSLTKAEFADMRDSGRLGTESGMRTDAGATQPRGERETTRRTGEDVSMPVVEEELDVVKRDREAGEVRLRKDVVTETKHLEVPVAREEVHVERVPAGERREVRASDKAFERDSVSVPIHEEEIEVRKRPVVKEEVRLRKERITEQRAADAEVRKERVEIEGDDGAHRIRGDEPESGSMRSDEIPGSGRRGDDELP